MTKLILNSDRNSGTFNIFDSVWLNYTQCAQLATIAHIHNLSGSDQFDKYKIYIKHTAMKYLTGLGHVSL